MSFAIIHITDIHLCDEQDPVLRKASQIVNVCNSRLANIDDAVLVVTGDLTNTGTVEQYRACCSFLMSIAESVQTKSRKRISIVAVPGNHDCDFTNDHDQKIRSILLESIKRGAITDFDKDVVIEATKPQENFFKQTQQLKTLTSEDPIASYIQLELGGRNICFQLYNTAWISELHERAGMLCMPINLIQENPYTGADLYISMAHHPLHWMNADNMVAFRNIIRTSSDVVLWGHEHITDNKSEKGDNWNLVSLEGCELQDRNNPDSSSFAIYVIDDSLDNLQKLVYSWKCNNYIPITDNTVPLERNSAQFAHSLFPNKRMIEELNDYGALIHHPLKEQITLDDLFVWPSMLRLDLTGSNNGKKTDSEMEIASFVSTQITIIVGDEATGKTALAKKLYKTYIGQGKCCILLNGQSLTARNKSNIEMQIDTFFSEQYGRPSVTQFHSLSIDEKILIIDDFDGLIQTNKRYGEAIESLKEIFGSIILFTGVDANISYIITQLNATCHSNILAYRIRHFGNKKRNDIINKWYSIGSSPLDDIDKEQRVANATETVNSIIEKFSKIAPATPLLVVTVLQTIDGSGKSNLTQYSYMYEQLVQRSLIIVSRNNQALQNIIVGILSNMAYYMLCEKSRYISAESLIKLVTDYKEEMILQFNPIDIIRLLIDSAFLVSVDENRFRFKYPYLYYYFAGLYISKHITKKEIKDIVDNLSEHLYVEDYGNIMIFVCHFTNNEYVIDSVLTCALCALDTHEEFDYTKPGKLLDSINELIEQQVPLLLVGSEADVESQNRRQLEHMDERGVHDGDMAPVPKEKIDDSPIEVAEIISAIRIIDVIGQILKNYPGEINRDQKVEMISGITNLAMRVISLMHTTIGSSQEELVQLLTDAIHESMPDISQTELTYAVKAMFASLVFGTSCSMIHSVSRAVGSQVLLPAIGVTRDEFPDNVVLKLIYSETGLISFSNTCYEELISLSKYLKKRKLNYAYQTMRMLVARHLRLHHCGVDWRNKLCDAYNLSKNNAYLVLPENAER